MSTRSHAAPPRRPAPLTLLTAAALLTEAVALAVLLWLLAAFVDAQSMSLADLPSTHLALAARAGGVLLAALPALCAFLLLRRRPPGRVARALLVACCLSHGILGAVAIALVSWTAFITLMLPLALLTWTVQTLPSGPTGLRASTEP
ncbi:hypothetical protein [Streptomyces alkaliterrae]|uniref:Uncharacterized protein n=1 Tax=Streptomyces alkaliterrae TaxID=2213162 RepID=A0A5P0YWH3_9ACTN|nr:hypothetical protein [Streptomyces alkaliterrae]MBB1258967.1 hypothetical protein [Streptomyces alkaliterrae]MQS04350.1 hypothetical protein [Streptomyces alkaliterrae]